MERVPKWNVGVFRMEDWARTRATDGEPAANVYYRNTRLSAETYRSERAISWQRAYLRLQLQHGNYTTSIGCAPGELY
jgi:hypothetical protein